MIFCTNPCIVLSSVLVFLFWCWVVTQVFLTLLRSRDGGQEDQKKTEDHSSAWEPEGSCRGRELRGSQQSDNAVRRSAQGKLNQVVSALICVLKESCAGSGLVWGHSISSTMGASSDKVSGDGLGLARGPECMGLRVAVWAIGGIWGSFR